MRLYGTEMPEKKGKVLCAKCKSYYESASRWCPWCDTPNPNISKKESEKSKGPTESDKELFNFLRTATEEQKKKIIRFIEDNL